MNYPHFPFHVVAVDKTTGRPRVELIYAPNAEDAKGFIADYQPNWIIVGVQ